MPRTIPLDDGIIAIDTEMGGLSDLVASYLIPGDRPAIFETGPATVASTLAAGVEQLGIPASDIAYLVCSHIHLDHAGGAGDLVGTFPNATVVVHQQGARHMADPSKLMASAERVFGAGMAMFGPLKPVPGDRLRAVEDGDVIDLGGRRLEVIYAPGHARHHMAVQDSSSGVLFVGDSMGVYLPEAGVLRPATPPPDFDLELALESLEKYRKRSPAGIYFTHFGPAPADRDMLAEAGERLVRFGDIIREEMATSTDLDYLASRLEERTREDYAIVYERPELLAKFESLNAFRSSVAGYLRYFQTRG
ncbi:MAG: MBL fold metallo-hydrolase [Actinomycetota bacterium]